MVILRVKGVGGRGHMQKLTFQVKLWQKMLINDIEL